MLIDLFDHEEENPDDFISFLVFEPASLRIPDNDLFLIGDAVTDLFGQVMASSHFEQNIQDQTLLNRLERVHMMIELLKSNDCLIMTKFLNKIWRRYAFFSNLGELFLSKKDIHRLVPSYTFPEPFILDRVVETLEDQDSNNDDNNNDNRDDESTHDVEDKTTTSD